MSSSLTVNIDTSAQVGSGTTTKRSPPSGISVLIVGAGPAGVYAALECWRKGHDVRIVERHPSASTEGDSFTITPQVIEHIRAYWPDMAEENDRIAEDPWVSYHRITGERVAGPESFAFGMKKKAGLAEGENKSKDGINYPSRMHRHNRPQFLKMLISQLQRLGIEIEYGLRAVDYYEEDEDDKKKAGVVFEDGRKLEADVVVAADGIGTKSHKLINGRDIRAWSSGWASARAAFPVEVITAIPELNERFKILENGHPCVEMWQSPTVMMFLYRTRNIINWGAMHKDKGLAVENWHKSIEGEKVVELLEKAVPNYPEIAKKLIRATPDGAIVDWPLVWRNPQQVTTSPKGRVVQVGDAAHTFLPSSGSGANQGIEDGIYLASCLQLAGKDGLAWGTKVHSTLRFERVSCCQKLGLLNHERRVNANPTAKDPSKIKTEYGKWIWAHDPEKYAYDNYGKALDHVRSGAPFQNTNIPPGYVHRPWSVDQVMADIEAGKPLELEGDWS
ncbi:hypothetical protein MGN70_002778 [Eutypa lata]|nr:hypothetical protein MGN70_002778 [Eutypa lata]